MIGFLGGIPYPVLPASQALVGCSVQRTDWILPGLGRFLKMPPARVPKRRQVWRPYALVRECARPPAVTAHCRSDKPATEQKIRCQDLHRWLRTTAPIRV